MADTEQVKNKAVDKSLKICPCCGKLTWNGHFNVEPDLVDHWLSCMMTGVPFSHTYELYDGKLKVDACALHEELIDLLDELDTDKSVMCGYPEMTNDLQAMLDKLVRSAKILIYIQKIRVATSGVTNTYKPQDVVREVIKQLTKLRKDTFEERTTEGLEESIKGLMKQLTSASSISALPPTVLFVITDTHSRLAQELESMGFDTNFWAGIRRV